MTNPNDPAYGRLDYQPMGNEHDGTTCVGHFTVGGLTKRELFAAMAMQGLLTNDRLHGDQSTFAIQSVALADALIEALNIGALNKPTETP